MSKLLICTTCEGKVSENARCCPHCNEPNFKGKLIKIRQEGKCIHCDGKRQIKRTEDRGFFLGKTEYWKPCSFCNGTGIKYRYGYENEVE